MSQYSRPHAGKLYIYYLTLEDAGDYECYLPNGRSERVRLTVNPKNRPSQNNYPEQDRRERPNEENFDKEVDYNANTELACKFTRSNPNDLRWRKRGGVS